MSTIVTRAGKGSPLTNLQIDTNFTNLNTDKMEKSANLSDVINTSTARNNLGLGSVDNTADSAKPISTLTQAALDLKANASAVSNVSNTSDANKPVSTATQAALNLKQDAASAVSKDSATGAANLPAGTTAQRPVAPVYGNTRANSTLNQTEWWNGSAWVPMGGGATGAPGNNVFVENDNQVTGDYTITAGKNAGSFGPVTVNNGVTVTVPIGSVWSIV